MKILLVSAMFPPIRTGTSFYSQNIAQTLYNHGRHIVVATVKNTDVFEDNCSFPVIRLKAWHINLKNYFKHLRFSSVYIFNYKKLLQISIDNDIEAVLLVNHYLDIAFPAIYVTRKLKISLYISVGTQMQSLNPIKNKILRILDRVICGRLIFPFCKNIISWDTEIERYIKEVQRKSISDKSVIIPFGVNGDISQFNNYLHNYSLTGQIIGVGAIISQRDYLFQLKVFKELLNDFPSLKLKIIGHIYIQSPIKLAEELNIRDKVEFLGEMPHEIVIDEMKKSAIHWMMLSGSYVGLGTATIEAMLLGIPSVSNAPETLLGTRLLHDLENYIFIDGNNDVLAAKNKICNILLNQDLRNKIGQGGRRFVQENMNWDKVAHKMIELFSKTTSSALP